MTTNTGGPAFPWCCDLNECPTINLGMTLRDYFAAKAMQGILACDVDCGPEHVLIIAGNAYKMADTMLKAREQK